MRHYTSGCPTKPYFVPFQNIIKPLRMPLPLEAKSIFALESTRNSQSMPAPFSSRSLTTRRQKTAPSPHGNRGTGLALRGFLLRQKPPHSKRLTCSFTAPIACSTSGEPLERLIRGRHISMNCWSFQLRISGQQLTTFIRIGICSKK